MNWVSLLFGTAFCLAMEAFFSGGELALVSADKLRLTHRAARKDRRAGMALMLARRPEWFFSATLLGQNLFIVANSILVTFFIFDRYGMDYEFFGLLLTPLVLVFGEVVPKSLSQQWADRLAPIVSPFILLFSYLFFPVVWPLSRLTLLLMGGVRGSLLAGHEVTRESLELLVRESDISRDLSPVFKRSLLKILAFARRKTHEVMTPLVEVFSLRDTTTVEEAVTLCSDEGYSSIPVFQKRAYNIVGIVNFRHLLLEKDLNRPVGQLMDPPLYASHQMGVRDLFLLLREQRKNFAVVVDEYGGTVGVVTLEDILEEVVGEIHDEYDEEKVTWSKVNSNQYLFEGRVTIDEINEKLHWALPKENYGTLAGFLCARFGRIPQSGEVLHYGGLTFLIKTASPRSIGEVLVELG